MLVEIRIDSLGAIKAADAQFDRGLTVLTGETGTGKTMVVTGLHLLGGARADADRVRSGATRAVVEGRFTTAEIDADLAARVDAMLVDAGADRDDDGSIIAMRSVNREGPSRAALGGRGVPARTLGGFTTELLTLHGQNDQLRLMRPDEQRAALDRYAGTADLLERYRQARAEWRAARSDLLERTGRARELAQEADRLKFALTEVDAVAPQPGEDAELTADIRRLTELDALREAAAVARAALSGDPDDPTSGAGAQAAIAAARSALENSDDPALRDLAQPLGRRAGRRRRDRRRDRRLPGRTADGRVGTGDQAVATGRAADPDPQIRRRRRRRAGLGRGVPTAAGPTGRLRGRPDRPGAPGRRTRGAGGGGGRRADQGTHQGGHRPGQSRHRRTRLLAMADAEFSVAVSSTPAGPDDRSPLRLPSGETVQAGPDGADAVEFGFTAHRGMAVLPLAKSASGGELSRVMLALEVVLAASTAGTTMVFDEVDAGVGGRAAVQIGRRLARLARTHQVIVVTHLPQVAAYADTHLVVTAAGGGAAWCAASMTTSGWPSWPDVGWAGDSDTARAHARELLDTARGELN
ncbi:DNA repair protein RecN [Mycolicibacterium insubricum]|uniref:DNA repair protein RecN n=1 Tax=Mycolicibacterium insubricum TaxID=444597 RepID=UPI0021F2B994|nr:DNA repair protein RecN [Mycolicibacterium insubricum]MCV7083352.1 DNA repair protein RecN [Mycolicibacterium insubricum]